MRTSLVVLLLAALAAPSARGAVAVAVSIPDMNAVHRDFAAGVVDEARARFALLAPPLLPTKTTACGTDEKCLVTLAARHDASHMLLVGIAAIGTAEFVVSVRLLDVSSGDALANLSDIATPGQNPRESGRSFGRRVFAKVSGLAPPPVVTPPAEPTSSPAEASPRSYDGISALSIAGWGLAGVSTIGAAVGAASVLALQLTTPEELRPFGAGVGVATAAGLTVGLGLVVLDQLIADPAP